MDQATIWKIINKYFEDNPQSLVRHHIESYNDFFKNGIFQIFKEKNPIRISTVFDEKINEYRHQCNMYFGGKDGNKIYFGKPIIYDDKNAHYMYPNEARLRNMTYGMTIHYDVEVEFIDILEEGQLPSLVGMTGGNASLLEEAENDDEEEVAEHNDPRSIEELPENGDQPGGTKEKQMMTTSKQAPPRKGRQKRQRDVDLTPAETALFREATAKSMIAPNKQRRTIILEKIYLGKFPIMVQSNYCILSGMPREIRHSMGECLNDVGGYFIIDGKEKTVVSQEKFGDNMLYIRESGDEKYLYSAEIRSVSENVSKPVRTLSVKIVAPTSSYTFKTIVVNIPNVRKPMPLFIVFRALGIISDKQIITMCLLDLDKNESMIDLFAPSVHDAGGILTQQAALKFIATFTKGKTIPTVLEILADYFLPHVGEMNFMQKAYYLGYITFRLLSVYTGKEPPTDRDNFKFKRIELVGSLMYDLFREYYTIQQRQIQLSFEEKIHYNQSIYADYLYSLFFTTDKEGGIQHNYTDFFRERTVEAGFKKAFKGNWGAQTHTKRIGVAQDLNRLSHNSMMSHLRKTNLPLDASVKLVGPRVLHSTQWGLFDPIDTPDGGNIGLHKHLSISAYVTQGYSREPMIRWLREKVEMKLLEECSPIILSNMTKIIINGLWAGVIRSPIEAVEKIRLFRRNGLIPIYTSATFDIKLNTVFIYTDAGRVCRPIFYKDIDTGKMSYESATVKKRLEEDDFHWNDLVSGFNRKKDKSFHPNNYKMYELPELYEGIDAESNPAKLKRFLEDKAILDYVDTNETENALIALNMDELENSSKNKVVSKYTHVEIHESLIFGMMSNLIIFPENNPATRNSFSCGQSKQACAMYHTNHQVRMDKTAVVLNSGQIPLVKTRYMEHINHEGNPYGENAIVAIMCYTGYNVEDAVLVNEGALKRGLFRTTYYSTYETHEEKSKSADSVTEKIFTNIENDMDVVGCKPGYDYSKLDKYGLIRENTEINDKTVLIGLTATNSLAKGVKQDMSKTPKKGQLGIVDKSFITDGEDGQRIAKIRVREMRIPNIGDKMASRAGQKGTIGLVIPEKDMPFTKDGIRPDIIVNPHAIPTRMTIGQLVETITGKACAMYGGYGECTAFINKGSKIGVFGDMLSNVGYHSSGNEVLYNGMTGEQIEAEIFMGPNYYMRLKHMVKDKINYRALGPRTALTRQPVSGRANDGGLRIGEMERDSVISHGMTDFLRESMMERGDKYHMAVCNKTGMLAIYNPAKNIFMSPMVDGPIKYTGSLTASDLNIENVSKFGRSFSVIQVPYSFKLLLQELQTMNVQMRIITEDNIEQLENMGYSTTIAKLMNNPAINPKQIVVDINATIRGIEKTASTPTPDMETPSPGFPTDVSPAYNPDGSPAYQPNEEEIMQMLTTHAANDDSPVYNPNRPYVSPNAHVTTGPSVGADGNRLKFSPKSPDWSPQPAENDVAAWNALSEQAKSFNVGEHVHFRGDNTPTRLWTITYIGDRFLKIETPSIDEENGSTSLMVTALEIYRPGDFTYSSPLAEPMIQQGFEQASGQVSGQVPVAGQPILVAPVFKMYNGNDFSTPSGANEGVAQAVTINPVTGMPEEVTQPVTKALAEVVPTASASASSAQTGVGKLDFSNLVIKKLGKKLNPMKINT